jgi:Tat protein translocase TatB subunit
MSLGPEKIILILVVALIVFGPQRLPEIARQVGAAMRELRKMQDTVRGELEQVLHPDFTAPDGTTPMSGHAAGTETVVTAEDTDHAALPPGALPGVNGATTNGNRSSQGDYPTEDITDDGFAGPRSFS